MANEPTDYLTVSGHLSGPVAAAFKRATPERGDASKYVRRAVEQLLESDGHLQDHTREADDIALIREARANGIDIATTLQAALLANLAK